MAAKLLLMRPGLKENQAAIITRGPGLKVEEISTAFNKL
jgi:hypothetical protein